MIFACCCTAALAAEPLVPFPHPLITEVLYAVPAGPPGDANGDGTRDATGDEFIELINPHDQPIQLKGYRLRDRNAEDKGALRFTFPALELKPGQVAVVFNGYESRWSGPVGDSTKAPASAHDRFSSAFVFTMKAETQMQSLANDGDWVLLSDAQGNPIQCVTWGQPEEKPPAGTPRIEPAPKVIGKSVQRAAGSEGFQEHPDARFSPGVFPPR